VHFDKGLNERQSESHLSVRFTREGLIGGVTNGLGLYLDHPERFFMDDMLSYG